MVAALARREVGLATGSGLLVLDVDAKNSGDDALDDLQVKRGKLPSTVECLSGGGGRHLYLKYCGIEVRNSAGKLGLGLDVRADGGYVLVPPSMHASGNSYRWELSSRIGEVSIAPAPDWLLALIRGPSPSEKTARPPSEWVEFVRGPIVEGGRNDSLARLAGHLFRIRRLDPTLAAEFVHVVNEARCRPPLAIDEVQAILESIAGRELVRERERIQ